MDSINTKLQPQLNDTEDKIVPKIKWSEFFIVICFFLLILSLLFYPAIFQGKLIYSGDLTGSDLLELNIPRRALATQALKEGEFPLWEPKLGNGLCLFAEGQSGLLYPTTVPFYSLFTLTTATNLSLLSTLLIALMGSYMWARHSGTLPLPALIGSLAYGLGGVFLFRLKHLNLIQVIAWLPWSLYAMRAYIREQRQLYLSLLSISWIFQIFAGHPHATYISWLACYMYSFVIAQEISKGQKFWYNWYKVIKYMVVCTAISLSICAVQLLPTYEQVQNSTRSQAISWNELREFPFKWSHLPRLITPFIDGTPSNGTQSKDIKNDGLFWESSPFVGAIPLLLACFSVGLYKKRPVCGLIILATIFLLMSFGPNGGIYWIFWRLCPGFNLFRFPARLLIPFTCIVGLLSAFGAQYIEIYIRKRYGTLVSNILLTIALLISLGNVAKVNFNYQGYIPASWENSPASLTQIQNKQRIYAPLYIFTWSEVIGDNGWIDASEKLSYALNTLPPDIATIWGVSCPSDRIVFDGGIEISSYFETQAYQFNNLVSTIDPRDGSFALSEELGNWLRLQNVSHIFSFRPMRQADRNHQIDNFDIFSPNPKLPKLYIYALKDPLPIARLVADDLSYELPNMARYMRDNFPAFQSGSLYEPGLADHPTIGSATIVERKRNTMVIKTDGDIDGYLILANTYHPNWKACLEDGTKVDIRRVNHTFQGLKIPAGSHIVRLYFSSSAFNLGCIISLLSLLLCIIYLLSPINKSLQKKAILNSR